MPQPKPRLPRPQRLNPLAVPATIDEAMKRLAGIENAVNKQLAETQRVKARDMSTTRKIIRQGYVANSDTVGWHIQNRSNHDWLLKRITIMVDGGAHFMGVFVGGGAGSVGALREICSVNTATYLNELTTTPGHSYTDSFDNDIYVRASDDMYIAALDSGAPSSDYAVTFYAILEIEEYVPYEELLTEDETYSMAISPDVPHGTDIDETGISVDPDDVERHVLPDSLDEMESDSLDVTGQQERPLIPDVSKHLPQ